MGRLVREALYNNEHIGEHHLRSNRGFSFFQEDIDNVETSVDCWERAVKRIKKIDPDGCGSLARELEMNIKN